MNQRMAMTACCLILTFMFSANSIMAEEKQSSGASGQSNAFGFRLYKEIIQKDDGKNLFLSPFSISTALTMTYAGARENTAREMAAVMQYNDLQEDIHRAYQILNDGIRQSGQEDVRLYIANALWGQENYGFRKEFLDLVENYYAGGFNTVDFIGETDQAAGTINQWVLKNTADKIKNLISKSDIDMDTRLVLTNAIYFKGDWAAQFLKEKTQKRPFYVSPETTVDADMMFNKGKFLYAEPEGGPRILELPYKGAALSMVVLLPRAELSEMEAKLNEKTFDAWLSQLKETDVDVFLPKFRFQTRYTLKPMLTAMGMPEAFTDDADFSGMTGRKDLYIGAVIHQADIDVNEEGTEAAAATAVVMTWKSMSMNPVFKADHPFIFMIRHKPSNTILFMGRVTDPSEGKK